MKSIELAKVILRLNFCFWLVYNWVFGFNREPLSQMEKDLDAIFLFVFWIGVFFYLKPLRKMYYDTIKERES